jgi:hypothetical protein
MIGKSTLRRARRSAMAVATILAAGAVVAPAAGAAIVHSTPVPTYQTNGRVNAIVIQNGVIYIAGRFTAVRPAGDLGSVTRNHAAALSQATGQVLAGTGRERHRPVAGGQERRIYLGGSFSTSARRARAWPQSTRPPAPS